MGACMDGKYLCMTHGHAPRRMYADVLKKVYVWRCMVARMEGLYVCMNHQVVCMPMYGKMFKYEDVWFHVWKASMHVWST